MRFRFMRVLCVGFLIPVVLVSMFYFTHEYAHASSGAISCSRTGTIVSTPNVGTSNNALDGIASVSSNDVWAVGAYSYVNPPNPNRDNTLTEHWNGSNWTVVPSPNVGSLNDDFYGVADAASNDVWAVGDSDFGSHIQPLIEHWDGSAWTVIPSPSTQLTINILRRVTVVSSTNVWAVGYSYGGGTDVGLIEHWNGSAWSIVSGANVGTNYEFYDIAKVSANTLFSVGYTSTTDLTLAEKWNGTKWSVSASANPGGSNVFYGATAIAGNNAWAVGNTFVLSSQTLVEHWDGKSWTTVASPSIANFRNNLVSVASVSANDVWAVGSYSTATSSSVLTEQWNGTSWSTIAGPQINVYSYFTSVARVPKTSALWAVGSYIPGSNNQTLAVNYC